MAREELREFFASRDPSGSGRVRRAVVDTVMQSAAGETFMLLRPHLDVITKGKMIDYPALLGMIFDGSMTGEDGARKKVAKVENNHGMDMLWKELQAQCGSESRVGGDSRHEPKPAERWTLSRWLASLSSPSTGCGMAGLVAEKLGGALGEDGRFRLLHRLSRGGHQALLLKHLSTSGLLESLVELILHGAQDLAAPLSDEGQALPTKFHRELDTPDTVEVSSEHPVDPADGRKVIREVVAHLKSEANRLSSCWMAEEAVLMESGLVVEERIKALQRTLAEIVSQYEAETSEDHARVQSALEAALEAKRGLVDDLHAARPLQSAAFLLKLLGVDSLPSKTCGTNLSPTFCRLSHQGLCQRCRGISPKGSAAYTCTGCLICEDCAIQDCAIQGETTIGAAARRLQCSGRSLQPYVRLIASRFLSAGFQDAKLRFCAEQALSSLLGGCRGEMLRHLRAECGGCPKAVKAAFPNLLINEAFSLCNRSERVEEQRILPADLKEGFSPSEAKAFLDLAFDAGKTLVDAGLLKKCSVPTDTWSVGEDIVLLFSDGVGYFETVLKVSDYEVTTHSFAISAATGRGFFLNCQAYAMVWAPAASA